MCNMFNAVKKKKTLLVWSEQRYRIQWNFIASICWTNTLYQYETIQAVIISARNDFISYSAVRPFFLHIYYLQICLGLNSVTQNSFAPINFTQRLIISVIHFILSLRILYGKRTLVLIYNVLKEATKMAVAARNDVNTLIDKSSVGIICFVFIYRQFAVASHASHTSYFFFFCFPIYPLCPRRSFLSFSLSILLSNSNGIHRTINSRKFFTPIRVYVILASFYRIYPNSF